jgi:flagellar hook-associated protein 2
MVMRIGGLASGMDIDTLVGDLMRAERMPLNKLAQKKIMLEWQRDDYRSMNKLLDELDQHILNGVLMQNKFLTKAVTSSNSNVVSATAKGSAVNTTTNIKVNSLAEPALWVSGTKVLDTYKAPADTTLTFDVTNGDGTTQGIKEIIIKKDDNVDTIISKFNSSGLGVSAFYDTVNDQFVLTKKDTGSQASITVQDNNTLTFMNDLGYAVAAAGDELGKTGGADASVVINGYATTRSSNTFDISGVTYTLQNAGTANITVANNTDSTFDMIKGFVDKYNETIEAINSKITEEKYRDFKPLTDEQRKDLSEKEAELWDEKAKSGMIRGDSILSGALGSMRLDLYGTVNTGDTNYDQLAEIGIKTSSNYLDKGKLVLDETKLRDAIAANPDAVMKMFTNTGTTTADKGIAQRLRETIDKTVDKIELKAGNAMRTNAQFTLGRQLMDMDKRISSFEDRLGQVEDRYWRQFSAMEKAIQRSNQQMAYLMQQFGGGQ